jgi:hypothetical protein
MTLFVDSCSLAIPLHLVTITSKELLSKIRLSKCESVLIADGSDNPDLNAVSFDDNPRIRPDLEVPICDSEDLGSVYYKVRSIKFNGDYTTCVLISLNSKMLTSDYYKGLTHKTLKDLHWFILSQNVVVVSLYDFENGLVSDIDVAHDFYDHVDIQKVSHDFKRTVKSEHKTRFKIFSRGKTGFSCGKRGDTYPEFKLYDKLADMTAPTGKRDDIKRKLAYTAKYLPDANHPTARLEVTFSNVSDMRRTGLLGKRDTNTLSTIIKSLTNDKASQAMGYRAKQYFNTTVISSKELNVSAIEGVIPPKCVIDKLEALSFTYNQRRAPLEHVIETMLIFTRRDNHKWAKNYLRMHHWTSKETEPSALLDFLGLNKTCH